MAGVKETGSAEASYYTWVDQFDTLGLGANMPINTGNGSYRLRLKSSGKIGRCASMSGRRRAAPGEELCPAASSWSRTCPWPS
jgi:hypothetical protein